MVTALFDRLGQVKLYPEDRHTFPLIFGEVNGHKLEGALYDTGAPSNIVRPEQNNN